MKAKFEVTSWRKCTELWEEIHAFKREAGEGQKQYLEKWLQLEAKIKNSREVITPLFLVTHFLERGGIEDITKQLILTMVKVKEKKTILVQVKKAFETLVANFNQDISAIIKERKEEKQDLVFSVKLQTISFG